MNIKKFLALRKGSKIMNIIFHIGAGKTGTSSIQGTFVKSSDELKKSGFFYLGLMLEHAPIKLFDWQKASATKEFLALNNEEAQAQVEKVLEDSIEILKNEGIHTLIWSNEWFFGRHASVLNPMQRLKGKGHNVKIIAYVRRHDAWAKSAYNQWGLKHKTYQGEIIPFDEYIKKRPVRFAGAFKPWDNSFGNDFILRNFDQVGDVVQDFADVIEVDKSVLIPDRVNETPGDEELVLRAIFNDKRDKDVMPAAFERLFQAVNIDFKRDPVTWLNDLLPSNEDLKNVAESSKEDQAEINLMLKNKAQPELSFIEKEIKPIKINHNIAYSILFQILERQAVQIQTLRKDVNELKNKK